MRHTCDVTRLSDLELTMLFQAGDERCLETLIDRYRRFARAKSRRYFLVGGDADDVLQEAMIGLYKAARDFRPDHLASFRSFADLCITRQIITAIKTATRQKHQPLNQYLSVFGGDRAEGEDRPLADLLASEVDTDPLDSIVTRERLGAMRHMIARNLSDLEIEVLSLYVDGSSYQEIGDHLGRHTKSIDNALQRIKRKLGQYLNDESAAERQAESAHLAVA